MVVQLGVDSCRRFGAVAQQLSDLGQRSTASEQVAGHGVPQPVRADHQVDAGASASRDDDTAYGAQRQPGVGSPGNDEQSPACDPGRSAIGQIVHQRLADIDPQRKRLKAVSLTPDQNLAGLPVDVIEL